MNASDFSATGSGDGHAAPDLVAPGVSSLASAMRETWINILIVDDEPKNLTVLETVLSDPGYRLVRAESAEQALLALVVEEFALLILDIRMPGMTGFELAQMIKERKKTSRVPIIFLTAYYNEDQHVLEGYSAGAVDYLHKPVNPVVLRSKVAVFAELHRKNRESDVANRILLAETAERRRAEEQLRNRTVELEAANKELEAFSYSVSHDLRAPLRRLDGFVRMLEANLGDRLDEESRRLLDVICKSAERMDHLIEDLLEFSRTGRQHVGHVLIDMTTLARDEFDNLAKTTSNAAPRLELAQLAPANGDPRMMRQVFANLIGNAIKFTCRQPAAVINIGSASENGETTYFVKDNGVGFDEKYKHKLFNVFQRLHSEEEFEGNGVGLALVQRIVQRHGGKVWAEGNLGSGAAFYFTLPNTLQVPD